MVTGTYSARSQRFAHFKLGEALFCAADRAQKFNSIIEDEEEKKETTMIPQRMCTKKRSASLPEIFIKKPTTVHPHNIPQKRNFSVGSTSQFNQDITSGVPQPTRPSVELLKGFQRETKTKMLDYSEVLTKNIKSENKTPIRKRTCSAFDHYVEITISGLHSRTISYDPIKSEELIFPTDCPSLPFLSSNSKRARF